MLSSRDSACSCGFSSSVCTGPSGRDSPQPLPACAMGPAWVPSTCPPVLWDRLSAAPRPLNPCAEKACTRAGAEGVPPKHHPSFSSPVQSYKTFIPGLQGEGRKKEEGYQATWCCIAGGQGGKWQRESETCPDPALPVLSDGGPMPIGTARGVPLLVANSSCLSPALLQLPPLPQLLSSELAGPPRPSPTVLWASAFPTARDALASWGWWGQAAQAVWQGTGLGAV